MFVWVNKNIENKHVRRRKAEWWGKWRKFSLWIKKMCWIIQSRCFSLLKASASREDLSDLLSWISTCLNKKKQKNYCLFPDSNLKKVSFPEVEKYLLLSLCKSLRKSSPPPETEKRACWAKLLALLWNTGLAACCSKANDWRGKWQ